MVQYYPDSRQPRAFLTEDVIREGIHAAGAQIAHLASASIANRNVGYFVVIDCIHECAMPDTPAWQYALLYESAHGLPVEEWHSDWHFQQFAKAKAALAWRERMSTMTIIQDEPWRLRVGDIRYPGGVYREPLIVAFSGIQGELDHAIATAACECIFGIARLRANHELARMAGQHIAFIQPQ